ncbi:DUF885 family protein [Granulicella sp. S156]|uniref:DUF885 domain-containing protein n=1 Tax=Granulicella sp. S156 TaxID=1747224 RepID=UPI00131D9A45|nr:DUF885 domain-containing protein [Granulicella sp. S156]
MNSGNLLRASIVLLACGVAAAQERAQTAEAKLSHLADRFVDQQLAYDPTLSYTTGLPTTDNSRFADRTPRALAALDEQQRHDLRELHGINVHGLSSNARATYANLREQLEANLQLRVCRTELWNVNHFDGWQSSFAEVAERQPVSSAEDRRQALQRWAGLPRYIQVEIANLKLGLAQGYSAPQSVVRRVIQQMDDMATADPEKSPFFSPAQRSGDSAFQASFRQLIQEQINSALRAYRDYLQVEYLPKAREGVAISDLPNGTACYQAFLRANTTLARTPREVFDLGQKTVNANVLDVQKIGERQFHSSDLAAILAAIKSKPAEHFQSREDMLAFSRDFLERTKHKTGASLISQMPKQDVVIRSLSSFEESAGVGSRFQQEPNPARPAVYLINLSNWKTQTRAEAEIVTVHETTPGHYLQKALAQELQPPTKLSKLVDYAAYTEGWARYAEAMGEEAGIYDTEDAAIMRRLWPARGMVVDPGLHAFHWTRQQAIDYIVASGRFTAEEANDYVDRIAVMPGQLTSYDSGGLEIKRLREEAKTRLGSSFDLRRFNKALLEEGVVPLSELRVHVEAWMAAEEPVNRVTAQTDSRSH